MTADFKTEPYSHQLREFEQHRESEARALLWQMRTGKTKAVVDAACHLASKGLIDAVVVLAPNGVHENWIRRELPAHHWESVEYGAHCWKTSLTGPLGGTRVKADERMSWQERHLNWWDDVEAALEDPHTVMWLAVNSESVKPS